ncbi:MAG TPA: hypothetical protein EYG79_10570 [Rhodobacteraceae bacterium]|nr:hypothetical protein [Paracoccaceae bacterium]
MADEDDLWFLPGPPIDEAPTDPPWRLAERHAIFEAKAWRRAEGVQGRGLARAAAAFARLDARASTGFAKRLAYSEASALLWAQGDWVPPDRIALYGLLRESAVKDAQVLSRADWATRRMLGAGLPDDLAGFLGRHQVEFDGFAGEGWRAEARPTSALRAMGDMFDGVAQDWQTAREGLSDCHAITQAAGLFAAWRAFGLSAPNDALEAGVAAGKIGGIDGRSLRFLPVATGGPIGQGGAVADRLARWYGAVENACLKAEMELEKLEVWQGRAVEATRGLSGKTPPLLIRALLETPALTAGMVAVATGADKATARRNLNAFSKLGLIREITGQGRYRVWVVA